MQKQPSPPFPQRRRRRGHWPSPRSSWRSGGSSKLRGKAKRSCYSPRNNTTTLVYDQRTALVEARVPHKTGVTRTTKFVYDEVGYRTKTITPRGVETTDDPDDFVAETASAVVMGAVTAKRLP
ncbi:hypothetical protein [Actinophytocola glycyrrhizae]|uniref:YD repeat-containing protein n=1 Tax=Actinophytocola glycyrrhizae TaxID=2044873 RepID=A0ABV9S527_9PSEU